MLSEDMQQTIWNMLQQKEEAVGMHIIHGYNVKVLYIEWNIVLFQFY